MKKKSIRKMLLGLAIIVLLPTIVWAESYPSPIKKIYEELDGKSGVEVVFMTRKMLELKFKGPLEGEAPEVFQHAIENFNEMVLLEIENGNMISDSDVKSLIKTIKSNGYEQVVRMSDGDESLELYLLEDPRTGKIKDMIFIALESDEQLFVSISGSLTMNEIAYIGQLIDIDFMDILDF